MKGETMDPEKLTDEEWDDFAAWVLVTFPGCEPVGDELPAAVALWREAV